MISKIPFLIGCGPVSKPTMDAGSKALAGFWGRDLLYISSDQEPNGFLMSFEKENSLIQVQGDAAKVSCSGGSWLESLAVWRQPVLLIVTPLTDGYLPGIANAYVALCKELSVPLIGLLQLGGAWDQSNMGLDGLPWCGLINSDVLENLSGGNESQSDLLIHTQEVIDKIISRYFLLSD